MLIFLLKFLCALIFGVKLWEKVGKDQKARQVFGFFGEFMGAFFSGSVEARLDEKGRFVLPQSMRHGLMENGVLEFSLGLGLGGCIGVYRQSMIEKMVETFRAKQHIGEYQQFFTFFFANLFPTTCDKVGRVVIPTVLKKVVGIHSEIVVAGVIDKIEIWPQEIYMSKLEALLSGTDGQFNLAEMTKQAFALLETDHEESAP